MHKLNKGFRTVIFVTGLLLTGLTVSCAAPIDTPSSPSASEAHGTLPTGYVEVPPAFEGIFAMTSVKLEPGVVELETDFPEFPDDMMVYQRVTVIDDDYARDLAARIGFTDEHPFTGDERKVYSFTRGDETLEILVTGHMTLRCSQDIGDVPVLPEDQECIEIAETWLKENGLYPENVTGIGIGYGGMSVATADAETGETGPTVYYSKSVSFTTAFNGYERPSGRAYILIGDGGKIVRADVDLADYREYGLVRLMTPEEAFKLLEINHARLTPVPDPYCFNTGGALKVTVDDVTLEYYATSRSEFLMPVYLFEGTSHAVTPEKFKAYVDAVAR